jgi:hypothetical protein
MKAFSKYSRTLLGITAALALIALVSCENNPSNIRHSSGPPKLDYVSVVHADSATTEAGRGESVVIIGKNLESTRSITFNGAEANVNLALATDHNIIVRVPSEAPYKNASDSLVVTNGAGSASLPFHIVQPPPTISGFSPNPGAAGDIITITGKVFDNADTVRFGGEENGKLAQIKTVTPTQIKAVIPQGIQGSVYITVITPGGKTQSEQKYGFKILVYGDGTEAFTDKYGPWAFQAFGADYDYQNTKHALGTHSIKITLTTNNYGALQIAAYADEANPLDMSDITTIKFNIYPKSKMSKIGVVLTGVNGSGGFDDEQSIVVTTGQWNTVTVPISKLGDPSEVKEIDIQGQTGKLGTFYIDNLGFY